MNLKVISFCLWGDLPKYNVGAIRNAELAQKIYPGWECRFHISNMGKIPPAVATLEKMPNVQIWDLDNYRADWGLMLARLEPGADEYTEVMISRDCDSRLSLREKAAVDEWIASDKTFHMMHDHPHHSVPILGGMFGIKGRNLWALELPGLARDWVKNNTERWQVDQDFLTQVVWPVERMNGNYLNHDQFFQHLWGGIPFPTVRDGLEFVGQVYDENDVVVSEHQEMLRRVLKGCGEPIRRENLPKELQ